jgi:hypothetical protein
MEKDELLALWRSAPDELAATAALSRHTAAELTQLKVAATLSTLKPLKWFGAAAALVWVILVDALLYRYWTQASGFFLVSAGVQVLLTKLALGLYLYQLALISRVDASAPVVEAQARLARLQASTLWVARLSFLQLPCWTTFYWSAALLRQAPPLLLGLQLLVTGLFAAAAVWLFLNINARNRHQRWFRLLFGGREWAPILDALQLLEQLDEYRTEPRKP